MRTTLIALACVTLLACGGGDDGSDEVTELITADEGGTIDLGDGTTIEIPANAVSEDVEVTVTVGTLDEFAPLDNARDRVIVFEPYMSLASSASITIDVGDPAPTPNEYAILEQFIDGVWIGVDASTIIDTDGLVHSAISTLAPTAVIIALPDPS